jgi:hypothetical protein
LAAFERPPWYRRPGTLAYIAGATVSSVLLVVGLCLQRVVPLMVTADLSTQAYRFM